MLLLLLSRAWVEAVEAVLLSSRLPFRSNGKRDSVRRLEWVDGRATTTGAGCAGGLLLELELKLELEVLEPVVKVGAGGVGEEAAAAEDAVEAAADAGRRSEAVMVVVPEAGRSKCPFWPMERLAEVVVLE